MSDFFTTFAASAPLWLLPLVLVIYVWGKMVKTGLNPENKASFQRTIGWLREERVEQLYLSALGGLMDRVGDLIGDRQKLSVSYTTSNRNTLTTKLFGFNPFTPESYEKCVLLACSYPVFGFLVFWIVGASGQIGNHVFLYSQNVTIAERSLVMGGVLLLMVAGPWFISKQTAWRQWLWLVVLFGALSLLPPFIGGTDNLGSKYVKLCSQFISIFLCLYFGGGLVGLITYRSFKEAHCAVYKIAVASALVSTIAFASFGPLTSILKINTDVVFFALATVANAGAIAVVSAIAGVSAVLGVMWVVAYSILSAMKVSIAGGEFFFFTITEAVDITLFGGISVGLQIVRQMCEKHRITSWYWIMHTFLFLVMGAAALNSASLSTFMILILFWIFFPLVNAPLDWLSLGVTRGLLQAVRSGEHSTRTALVWAAMDLILALIFLFLITAVLVGATALGNGIAGETLVDIQSILQGIKEAPASVDHWWIYLMLLSTLVPTLIHFALAGGAATLWLPRKWRLSIADGLEHDVHKTQLAWVYLTFTPIVGFIVMPAALLFFLWWLVNVNGAWLGTHLLEWAQWLANTAGAL